MNLLSENDCSTDEARLGELHVPIASDKVWMDSSLVGFTYHVGLFVGVLADSWHLDWSRPIVVIVSLEISHTEDGVHAE